MINPKPLYTDSLNSWVGHIPADVEDDMAKIAPMLKTLGKTLTIFGHSSDMSRMWHQECDKITKKHSGYDPEAKNPYYGKPDQEVSDKVSFSFYICNNNFFLLVQCMVERARRWCAECSTRSWYRTRFIIKNSKISVPVHGSNFFLRCTFGPESYFKFGPETRIRTIWK